MLDYSNSVLIGVVGLCVLGLIGGAVITGAPGTSCSEDLAFTSPSPELDLSSNNTTNTVTVTYTGDRPLVQYPDSDRSSGKRTISLYLMLEHDSSEEPTRYMIANASNEFPITSNEEFSVTAGDFGQESFTAGDQVTLVWNRTQARLPSYCLTSRDPDPMATSVDQTTIER
jgi:hypothetical protein